MRFNVDFTVSDDGTIGHVTVYLELGAPSGRLHTKALVPRAVAADYDGDGTLIGLDFIGLPLAEPDVMDKVPEPVKGRLARVLDGHPWLRRLLFGPHGPASP